MLTCSQHFLPKLLDIHGSYRLFDRIVSAGEQPSALVFSAAAECDAVMLVLCLKECDHTLYFIGMYDFSREYQLYIVAICLFLQLLSPVTIYGRGYLYRLAFCRTLYLLLYVRWHILEAQYDVFAVRIRLC